jgi:predicted Rdx family selenoprotein
MKTLTVEGHENLTLKPQGWGMFEIFCKVWEDGKRNKDKDGYFPKSVLKVK